MTRTDPSTGATTTIAGNGSGTCDGLGATSARLGASDVAFDGRGNLVIGDGGRIRRVDARTGVISTIAGGARGRCRERSDDPVPACTACLDGIEAVAVAPDGDVVFWQLIEDDDGDFARMRRISAATGLITTLAGRCHRDWSDGRPVLDACLTGKVVFDANGDWYLGAYDFGVVRVDAATGNGTYVSPGWLLGLDAARGVFLWEEGRVSRLDMETGERRAVAGGDTSCPIEDGQFATGGCLHLPAEVDRSGDIVTVEVGAIRRVVAATGRMDTLARQDCPGQFSSYPSLGCNNAFILSLGPGGRVAFSDYSRVYQIRRDTGDGSAPPASDVMAHTACAETSRRECVQDADCVSIGSCADRECADGACVRRPLAGRPGLRCALRELRSVSTCAGVVSSREVQLRKGLRRLKHLLNATGSRRTMYRSLDRFERVTRRLTERVLGWAEADLSDDCEGRILERLRTLRILSRNLQDSI